MKIKCSPKTVSAITFSLEKLEIVFDKIKKEITQQDAGNDASVVNIVSLLSPVVELFKELKIVESSTETTEKMVLIAKQSIQIAIVTLRLLKQSMVKGLTTELEDIVKRSGLDSTLLGLA